MALVIFALCAMVLSAQSTSTITNQQRLIDKQVALWVAKNTLVEQRISLPPPTAADRQTEYHSQVTQARQTWAVTRRVEPTNLASLKKITVTVRRQTDSQQQSPSARLVSFVHTN